MSNSHAWRMTARRHLVCTAVFLPLGFVVATVHGQQAPGALAPIIVSAEPSDATLTTPASIGSGLALSPLETPASVSVVTRAQMEERGSHTVVDALGWAGGVSSMGHPGNGFSALSTRGFSDSTSVMWLYDGVRQYGGVGITFPFDTWSVDRVEVLRGPASVIYGDGAIGGVVNVVPRKPRQGDIRNEIEASIGTEDTARLGFDSSGSLSDSLSYRVDVSGNYTDGWVDKGHAGDATFSGAVRWDVNPDLNFTLTHAYGYQRPMRYFGTPMVEGRQDEALRGKNYNVRDSFIRFRDQWTQLDAMWTPDAATTVRSRLYHVESKRDWRNAENYLYNLSSGLIDRSGNTSIAHDQKQTGMTANVARQGAIGRFGNQASVGFDINHASFQHANNTYVGSSGSVDPYHPEPGEYHSDIPHLPRYRNEADQFSLFAEDRVAFSEQWSVLGGVRYDHSKIKRQDLLLNAPAFSRTYSNVGWRVGTVYEIQPDFVVYAQYSRAADPVGGLLMISAANSQFEMSTGRQVEVGMKRAFWNERGEWTLAAYHIRKNNLLTRDPLDPSQRIQVGSQSSRGLEASLSLMLAQDWKIEANAAMLRARYDDFTDSSGGVAVSRNGNVPTNVPQRLGNLWVSWNVLPDWTLMGGLQYVGKRYANNANTLELPSYTTVDLAIRWEASRHTTLTARGYNIFDRAYFTTAYYTDSQWFYGSDRRFELTLNHRF